MSTLSLARERESAKRKASEKADKAKAAEPAEKEAETK